MKGALTVTLKISTLLFLYSLAASTYAEVEGMCNMCHKYPGFGIIEKKTDEQSHDRLRLFYINDDLFSASYHGKIRCFSCHTDVDKIPHNDLEPVDCGTDCHILEPSVNEQFSHKSIVDDLRKSAHGAEGSRHEDKGDLPVCKDCHTNKTYHLDVAQKDANISLAVCEECHVSKGFVKYFYEHIGYRIEKRRNSKEVVALCSTCHADQELMDKHDLHAVSGFSSTFHAKAISYGDEKVANCLNCHAPYEEGFSPHRIMSWKDNASPVSIKNKLQTCSQSDCHKGANNSFATVSKIHQAPDMAELLTIAKNRLLSIADPAAEVIEAAEAEKEANKAAGEDGTTDETSDGAAEDTVEMNTPFIDPVFHALVVYGINLFYKVIIALILGFFIFHRCLDLYSTMRNPHHEES